MKWWQKALLGALLIAEGGVFLIVLPVLAYTKQMRLEDYIQVGALLLSWPVAATVIVLFFARQFHEAIDVFLRNVGSMKLPGGVELQRQQPQRVEASGESASGIVPGAEEPVEEVLEEVVGLSDEERSNLQSQIANLVGWVRYRRFSLPKPVLCDRNEERA